MHLYNTTPAALRVPAAFVIITHLHSWIIQVSLLYLIKSFCICYFVVVFTVRVFSFTCTSKMLCIRTTLTKSDYHDHTGSTVVHPHVNYLVEYDHIHHKCFTNANIPIPESTLMNDNGWRVCCQNGQSTKTFEN